MLLNNLLLAFITGLVSSFGHCLGMCGGIVAIYSARQAALLAPGAKQSLLAKVGSLAPVHLGRISTYVLFGGLIGLAGSLLDQAGSMMGWQGLFSVLVGVAMFVVALSLLGVLPPVEMALSSLTGGATPMGRMRTLFGKQGFWASWLLGALWGFLPCGLVFAMLVLAAGTQPGGGGALTMLTFGLGTIPTLLGFGLAANLLSPRLRGKLTAVAAWLILLFAVQTILPRAGCGLRHPVCIFWAGDAMVEKVICDHCGAETPRPVVKEFDGKLLNFCCKGCLQVYELLREEAAQQPPQSPK